MKIKEYIIGLTEKCSDQVQTDLEAYGMKITWVSKILPSIIAVETNKSKEELEQFYLVETVEENEQGYYSALMNTI